MKLLKTLVVAALLMVASPAFAETSIGILDLQRLLQEAKAAQNIQDQVNAQREQFSKELDQEEQALREKEKAIIDAAKDLSKEELQDKRIEFQKAYGEARAKAQASRDRIERALLIAMGKLREEIAAVVEEISKEDGYDLVLARQNLIAGGEGLDISDKTLERLNKKVSTIALEFDSQS